MKVNGKVILVTGGGNGLGRELVLDLLARGATVAAADIRQDALNETARLADQAAERLSIHRMDVSDREAVRALADDVIRRHGCIDAIVNNAGIIHPFKPVSQLDYGIAEKMINVNLYGVINITMTFLPLLLERPEAHIANVSSMGGLFAFPGQTYYGASKAGVKVLSEGLYSELRGSRIGVTVAYPGAIDTNITKHNDAHTAQIEKFSGLFRGTQPRVAARKIIDAIEARRFRVVIGIDAKVLSVLYRLAPKSTVVLIGKVMKKVLKV
jgi:short-subunit dehydrogenase